MYKAKKWTEGEGEKEFLISKSSTVTLNVNCDNTQ